MKIHDIKIYQLILYHKIKKTQVHNYKKSIQIFAFFLIWDYNCIKDFLYLICMKMNKFRVNLHPAFFDVPSGPRLNEGVLRQEDLEERAVIERTQEELQRVQDAVVDPRRNNEALASWVEKVDLATDKELVRQLKQLAKNKKIDFPWTDNAWKCSRAEKKLATSSAKVFQQLLDAQTLTQMISKCKSKSWELNVQEAEAWKTELKINSKPKDIQNFYKAFKEYQNPQSEYQHLKNLMWFFCESDFSNIEDVSHALETRSQKISRSDIEKWARVLYQEWDQDGEHVIIDNVTGQRIDRKPKDWKRRASFEVIKDRLKDGQNSVEKMLTLLWDFNLDGEVNSGDVWYKTWSQVADVFRRTVATKALEDKTFTSDKAVENLAKYANKFGVNMENVQTVDGLYAWMTDSKKWYENTITLQNFLKNLSIELWDVLENWENAWQQSLDRMVSTIWLEKKEEEVAKKAAEEKAKEIVSAWEAKLKEVIKDDRERANITQQLLTQLPAMLVDKAMWEKNNWLGIGYGMPLDQIIKWMSAGFNVWIGTDWKPKFWLFVWWDRKFDLSKTTDLRTAVSAGTKLLFVPCMATSIELGQDVNKWSRDNSLDAKGEHRIVLWWNVTAVPWIFSYGFSAGYENDKQRGIEKQAENINKVMKNQAKGRIESLKGAEKKEDALRQALRAEFPKTSDEELNAATRNLLSIIQQFKIDEKTTAQDVDIYAQIVADVYSEQWRNAKLSWIADNKRKISWWKVGIQFIAGCVPLVTLVAKFTKYRNARTNETEHSREARIDAQVNGTGNKLVNLWESKEIWAEQVNQINEILKRYGAKTWLSYIEWVDGKPWRIQVPATMSDGIWINIRVSESMKWYVKKESDWFYSFPANATYRLLQETGWNQRSLTLNIGSDRNATSDIMISDAEWMKNFLGNNELMWGKKWQDKEAAKSWFEKPSDKLSLLSGVEVALRDMDTDNRKAFSEFTRDKVHAKKDFDQVVKAFTDALNNSPKIGAAAKQDFIAKFNALWNEDKQLIIDRVISIAAYYEDVHNETGLQKRIDARVKRGDKYKTLTGPNWQEIFSKFKKDYRSEVVANLKGSSYASESMPNILWATAFYNKRLDNDARWLGTTWLWVTTVLWWKTVKLDENDAPKAKDWFLWEHWILKKEPYEWNNLKILVKEKLPDWAKDKLWDDNLKKILSGEEVEIKLDNSEKKVKVNMNVDYVFYLMWECGNESVGMQLWDLTVVENEEVGDYRQWELYLNNGEGSSSVGVSRKDGAIGIAFGWQRKKKEEEKPEEEPKPDATTKPTEEESDIPETPGTTTPWATDGGEVNTGWSAEQWGEWQGSSQSGDRPGEWTWDNTPPTWDKWSTDEWELEPDRN